MNKQYLFISILCSLAWLLFLTGSSQVSMAQQDTIKVSLTSTKMEFDLCSDKANERDFILEIQPNRIIKKTDSLMLYEIVIEYNTKDITFTDILTYGTLSEYITDYPPKRYPAGYKNDSIALTRIEGGNITRLLWDNTEKPIVVIKGQFKKETVGKTTIKIDNVFFNEECKMNYYAKPETQITLTGLAKNLADRKIALVASSDTTTLTDTTQAAVVNYKLNISNTKWLEELTTTFEIESDNVEFDNIDIDTAFQVEMLNIEGKKINIGIKVKDSIKNEQNFAQVRLVRTNADSSITNLKYEINDVNQNACSMNLEGGNVTIVCPLITSIEEDNENETIITNDNKILLKNTNYEIEKLINILGIEVNINDRVKNYGIDLTGLNKGAYILLLKNKDINNKKVYKHIKLIIN